MVLAPVKEPRSVSQQCVLVATKVTDIIDNKDITTLNVTQHWEIFTVKKHHCLY
jgi:hypothetical protein